MIRTMEVYLVVPQRARHPIVQPRYKIGGNPVFLVETEWPRCSSCGNEMMFIAQIPLQNPLKLSETYDIAYVFMCRADDPACSGETWEPFGGVNAVILQRGENAIIGTPQQPSPLPEFGAQWTLTREPHLVGDEFDSADQELIDRVYDKTKLGGSAAWLQGNDTPDCPQCGRQMKLAAQIDAVVDRGQEAPDSYVALNFGDGGLSYLFVCPDSCSPQGAAFLWQCS